MTLPAPARRAINADLERWGRMNRAQVIAWLKRNRRCFSRAFRAGLLSPAPARLLGEPEQFRVRAQKIAGPLVLKSARFVAPLGLALGLLVSVHGPAHAEALHDRGEAQVQVEVDGRDALKPRPSQKLFSELLTDALECASPLAAGGEPMAQEKARKECGGVKQELIRRALWQSLFLALGVAAGYWGSPWLRNFSRAGQG